MRLIKSSYEIWQQPSGLEGVYKQIERVSRVCYRSEDKITEDSAKPFVDRMIKSGHGAMLEHGTVYLYTDYRYPNFGKMIDRYTNNKYSKCNYFPTFPSRAYISSNLRVLVENDWLDDLKYLCKPTEYHEKRICVKFICDRGILAEFTRHRTFSFSAESTRYCNYSKDKFDNELTFIQPCWLDDERLKLYGPYHTVIRDKSPESIFIANLNNAESDYLDLIRLGWKPQEARAVLPNSLKTELVMTGFVSDWKHFFDLRAIGTTGQPHPQAKELALPLLNKFITNKYL